LNTYLIQHALDHVWCSPEQDYQHLFQPRRLTVPKGVKRFVDVEWLRLQLPDSVYRYHVYQIGQLSPDFLNLLPDTQRWYTGTEAVNRNEITIDLYTQKGLHIPLFESYFRKTETFNLIIAIRDQPRIFSAETNVLYARFYSNAYFTSERSQFLIDRLYTNGKRIGSRVDTLSFQKEINDAKDLGTGFVYVMHNGWLVNNLVTDQVNVDDVVEYVHDTSVDRVWDVTIDSLETFNSTLDSVRKYLIKQPNAATDSIDYHDDLDFWVYRTGETFLKGIFFHKGHTNCLRMVTHSAYAMAVQSVLDHAQKVTDWIPNTLSLRVVIRKSGYDRGLVFETNRIRELYRLSDLATLQAMVGAHALVPEWQAAHLEASAYTAIMAKTLGAITSPDVQLAYGYNAVSKIVGEALHRPIVEDGRRVVHPPFKLRYRATAYEYTIAGTLIDFHYHNEGRIYTVKSPEAYYIEFIVGQGGDYSGTINSATCSHQPSDINLRPFITPKRGGVSINEWRRATPRTEYVQNDQGILWLIDFEDYATAIRNDHQFLSKHLELAPLDGLLTFTIEAKEIVGTAEVTQAMEFPTGKLDLFLNGHPLIENLDFFVQWPTVVICNKEYLLPALPTQKVTVRATNFPTDTAERLPPNEFGYITHGYISRNNRFDVRDDRVLRYLIEGRLWAYSDLTFSEDLAQVTVPGVRNGAPYLIDEIIVPMDELENNETYRFRDQARVVDQHVSDYLTLYYPEPEILGPSIIERRYQVLSPFVSRIHHALSTGFLYPEGIKGQYSVEDLCEWVKDYLPLLDYDPILNGVDDRYVNVQPHQFFTETTLDIYQYTFLERVIQHYLQGRVDLTSHVRVKAGWL
jgi:hypothetical protein